MSGLEAGVLCRLVNPTHAESMQNKPVGERQSVGLEDCSVGIVDELVSGDAPRLVTNHSRAMLACGAGIVLIAMKMACSRTIALSVSSSALSRRAIPFRSHSGAPESEPLCLKSHLNVSESTR